MSNSHEFLWIDLETTGLDPRTGRILEFAAVLCADAQGDDLRVISQYHGVVHYDEGVLDSLPIEPFVRDMHTRNGLWDAVAASDVRPSDVDTFLASLADGLTGGKLHSVRLAGSSVHFDLAWVRAHLPAFRERVSHRVLDVTTLRAAVDAWAPAPVQWPAREAHRALPDILATIEEAKVARAAMGFA